ncbi:unnamed protein product, partial [Musa hybrid cultivar]
MTLLPGNHQKQLANSTSCSSWIYQINHLAGQMPRTLGGLCSLTDLRLNSNNFNGELADVVDGLSSCTGGAALSYLSIEGNKFNGIIPYNLGQFSGMYRLDLSSNSLEGDITEAH